MEQEKAINDIFIEEYKKFVESKYPEYSMSWPFISGFGHSVDLGIIGDVYVLILKNDTGSHRIRNGIGNLSNQYKVDKITNQNKESVRIKIMERYSLSQRGAVVFIGSSIDMNYEFQILLDRHAIALGIFPMKIFLSHKGSNKEIVRKFDRLLKEIGFDTWLDEDSMPAGTNIHRGIMDGFEQSCASVFFITKEFKDEAYLRSEIDWAIDRHTKDSKNFRIITLVLDKQAVVPGLLQRFLWKETDNYLDAVREIIRALPIKVGLVHQKT